MNNSFGIQVYDDCFSWADKQRFYGFLRNSSYKISGGAGLTIEQMSDVAMQCMFSCEDMRNFGFIDRLPEEIKAATAGYNIERSYALILNHLQNPHFHTDGCEDGLTLVYYANLYWDKDWGGETLFANDTLSEVIYTSMITPGRIVLFDSRIPHKPSIPTPRANAFRLTFVINFTKNTN